MNKKQKILIIAPGRIGDAVLVSGVIDYYVSLYPSAKFVIAAGDEVKALWRCIPCDKPVFISFKKLPFNLHWFKLFAKSCFYSWDLIIDFRSSVVSKALISQERITPPPKSLYKHKVFQFSSMVNNRIKNRNSQNKAANFTAFPVIWQARKKLPSKFCDTVVLAIGASWAEKVWSLDNFQQLVILLVNRYQNLKFMVLAGNECYWANDFLQMMDKQPIPKGAIINGVGKFEIDQVIEVIRNSKLVISHDTGLMHIAAALNKSIVALFGGSNSREYAPFDAKGSNRMMVIVGKGSLNKISMDCISVSRVFEESVKLL